MVGQLIVVFILLAPPIFKGATILKIIIEEEKSIRVAIKVAIVGTRIVAL